MRAVSYRPDRQTRDEIAFNRGVIDGFKGEDRNNNPYTITHLRGAWLDGWFWVNRKCKAKEVE